MNWLNSFGTWLAVQLYWVEQLLAPLTEVDVKRSAALLSEPSAPPLTKAEAVVRGGVATLEPVWAEHSIG